MNENPYQSPETIGDVAMPTPRRSRAVTWGIQALITVALVGLAIALLMPVRRSVRPAARRAACSNNLAQIALALQQYVETYQALPPAYTVDASGKRLHSWRTLILPYLEQQALYERIDLSKPWDDPANAFARDVAIPVFRCPALIGSDGPVVQTNYMAVVGPQAAFQATSPRKLSEITDDHDVTLLVVEVDGSRCIHWMSPHDPPATDLFHAANAEKNPPPPHEGGVQGAFVSGVIRYIPAQQPEGVRRALISIDGGDDAIARKID